MGRAAGVITAKTVTALGVGILSVLLGCSEQRESSPQNFQVGWVQDVTESAAFRTAKATLREYDFRIDTADPKRGIVKSVPSAQTIAGGTGRLRDTALRYPNRVRRTATLVVVPYGESVNLRCKVLMERLDTIDHQTFRREHTVGDVPTDTPIDEEGGVSSRQNEVWTPLRRDRELERQMLAAWMERLTGGARPK